MLSSKNKVQGLAKLNLIKERTCNPLLKIVSNISTLSIRFTNIVPVSDDGIDLYAELWRACAGPHVFVPQVGDWVVFFPQGHMEQVT